MTDYTYYLNADLATGSDDGTSEANAWRSWGACVTWLNANRADLTAASDTVTVQVEGSETIAARQTISVVSTSTNYLKFICKESIRSPGVYDAANAQINFGAATGLDFDMGGTGPVYVIFDGLNFTHGYTGGTYLTFFANTAAKTGGQSAWRLENCFIYSTTTPSVGGRWLVRSASSGCRAEIVNCVVENNGGAFGPIIGTTRSTADTNHDRLDNCTFSGVGEVSQTTTARVRMLNCLLVSTGHNNAGFDTANCAYNASTAASGLPGSTGNTHNISSNFASATDFHIAAANGYGVGPSDGTYGGLVPATDIDGDTRSGATTDAGADLYPVSGIAGVSHTTRLSQGTAFSSALRIF